MDGRMSRLCRFFRRDVAKRGDLQSVWPPSPPSEVLLGLRCRPFNDTRDNFSLDG